MSNSNLGRNAQNAGWIFDASNLHTQQAQAPPQGQGQAQGQGQPMQTQSPWYNSQMPMRQGGAGTNAVTNAAGNANVQGSGDGGFNAPVNAGMNIRQNYMANAGIRSASALHAAGHPHPTPFVQQTPGQAQMQINNTMQGRPVSGSAGNNSNNSSSLSRGAGNVKNPSQGAPIQGNAAVRGFVGGGSGASAAAGAVGAAATGPGENVSNQTGAGPSNQDDVVAGWFRDIDNQGTNNGVIDDLRSVLQVGDSNTVARIVFDPNSGDGSIRGSLAYRMLGTALKEGDISVHGPAFPMGAFGATGEFDDEDPEAANDNSWATTEDSLNASNPQDPQGKQADGNNQAQGNQRVQIPITEMVAGFANTNQAGGRMMDTKMEGREGGDIEEDEEEDEMPHEMDPQVEARKKSVAINRRYRKKVQNSISELQSHLEMRNLCPYKRRLSRAEAANRSLAYIRSLEQKIERLRRACDLSFIIQSPEMIQPYLEELCIKNNYDEKRILHAAMEDLLHVFDFGVGEIWKVDYESNGREVLTYYFGVRRLCLSSDTESLLNMFEISSERMKFAAMEGLPGRTFSMKQSQFLPSAADSGQFLRSKQAEKAGIHSGYAFPLLERNAVKYVAVFLHTERRDFNYLLFNAVQNFFSVLSNFRVVPPGTGGGALPSVPNT